MNENIDYSLPAPRCVYSFDLSVAALGSHGESCQCMFAIGEWILG